MQQSEDPDDFDELDRLVDRELQTLLAHMGPRRQSGFRPGEAAGARHPSDAASERRHDDAAQERRRVRPLRSPGPDRADNVVRAHPLARRPRAPHHMQGLFAPEEEAFLANATDWLSGRPNADILLETLARRVSRAADLGEPPEIPDDAGTVEDWVGPAPEEPWTGRDRELDLGPEPVPGDAAEEHTSDPVRAPRSDGMRPAPAARERPKPATQDLSETAPRDGRADGRKAQDWPADDEPKGPELP